MSLSNGFTPTNGQSFAIVNYGSHTGQFSSQHLPLLPVSLGWKVDYGANVLTLNVIQQTVVTDAVKLGNGHFQFSLNGPAASYCLIEASTNLVNWIPLLTNSPFSGSLLFDDPQATIYSNRFYQVLIQQ